MTKSIPYFCFVAILIALCSVDASAQLKADFEADTLRFCPPYSVKFNDLSTGGRISSRRWDFGQGGSSNNNDPFPSASYIQSGKYDVKLVVSDGVNVDSITKKAFIVVHKIPIAQFSTTKTPRGCKPLDVNFIDNTLLGDAPIQSFDWNFGDGSKSNQNNPKHRYHFSGKYSVVYNVTDTNGCYSSVKKQSFVDVLPGPKVKFSSSNPPNACFGPHKVNFTNQTTGMNPITYRWEFGNGQVSNAVRPSQSFNSGVFYVRLIATDSAGCKDTLTRPRFVTVGAAKADFTSSMDTFCLTDSNRIFFTNTSIGGNVYNWDFGDGTTSTLKNPNHRYTSTGTYTVKLSINSGPGCVANTSKKIEVIQPKIDFTTDINYWCKDTLVGFIPKSTFPWAVSKMYWLEYKSFDTAVASGLHRANFHKSILGWNTDTLFAFYEKWGTCRDSVVKKSIRIWEPTGSVTADPPEGCVPLNVKYSHNIGPQDSLVGGGIWDFGSSTGTGNPIFKTYNTVGIFQATFKIRHKRGCWYVFNSGVQVGKKPKADFKVDKTTYCAGEEVIYTNLSTDTNLITNYFWNLDIGVGIFSFDKHEQHTFSDTGKKSAILIVGHNGCSDTIVKKNLFEILGPTGEFLPIATCDSVYRVTMAPLAWTDYHRFKYDFGDFYGVDSTNPNAKYDYISRGDYNIKLSLFNDSNGCVARTQRKVKIRDIKLVSQVTPKNECFPYTFTFNTRQSQDVVGGKVLIYGVDSSQRWFNEFKFTSMFKGAQRPVLIGYDANGCPDTNYLYLKTFKPDVKIHASVDSGCGPLNVQFSDSSSYDTTLAYKRWFMAHHGIKNTSHPFQQFKRPGSHLVNLKVVDDMGCFGQDLRTIKVISPTPAINSLTQICVGEPITFWNPNYVKKEQHFWDFGNGKTGTGDSSQTTYSSPGKKNISVRVVDSMGCDSTVRLNQYLNVQEVKRPSVVSLPKDTNCYPAEISFLVTSNDTSIKYLFWRFDSSEAYIQRSNLSSFYTYDKPGNYGLDLKVETSFGCKDSFRFNSMVNVGGPYARFNANDTVCLGENTEIKLINPKDVYQFQWDFGDGNIDTISGDSSSVFHVYRNGGVFPIYLIFTDSLGDCVKSFSDTVFVQEVNAKINLQDTNGCTPFDLVASTGNQPVDEYQWYVDGRLISKNRNLQHEVEQEGLHQLSLIPLNTVTGCNAKDSINFVVHPLPELKTIGGGIYCQGDSVLAVVKGAKKYSWSPTDYLSSSTNDSVKVAPGKDVAYTITGTDKNGCINTTSLTYKVIYPPNLLGIKDTTLFLGEVMQVEQNDKEGWRYTWDPPLFLSCITCPNPEIEGTRNITYTVSVSDEYNCFSIDTSFTIYVEDDYSLLIPNAFSPNDDDLNETFKIYARGIKELMFFGIYNRWGEEVYVFSDLEDEWDGTYRGEPWPTNSKLVYKGLFERFNGEVIDITGFIVLVK